MSTKNLRPPEISDDPIAKDFLDALDRLVQGKPRNSKLKKAQARGTLKIHPSSVALESTHSRTLIGTTECRYPHIRRLVLQGKSGVLDDPRTHTELISQLRADKTDLAGQVKMYSDEATAHMLAREKAESALRAFEAKHAKWLRDEAAKGKVFGIRRKGKGQSE
jgi:hypothetical protein